MDKRENQGSEVRNTKKSFDRMQAIFKTLAMLRKKYPKAFKKNPEPLKLGILEDIAKELKGEVGRIKIKKALRYYANSVQYQQAIMRNRSRVDLKGEETSEITEEHRAYAQEQLGKFVTKMLDRNKKVIKLL